VEQEIWTMLGQLLWEEGSDLNWWQMAVRAALIYGVALLMVRLGEKRFLGKNTAFDVILGIILGSVTSRAINSSAPVWPTVVAGFVLVGLHWLLAVITFHSDSLGNVFKGRPRTLIKEGQIKWDNMAKSHISEQDLLGGLRLEANLNDPGRVEMACLERNGTISVIPRQAEARVVEVSVEAGVQTIRIEVR
jgi:uncharacterized membrane protein YcaP (DUF421 family)